MCGVRASAGEQQMSPKNRGKGPHVSPRKTVDCGDTEGRSVESGNVLGVLRWRQP